MTVIKVINGDINMSNVAILGHATRGKEVIEILEMLGGKNKYHFRGDEDEWFVLNGNIQRSDRLFAEKGFTLEEFLEKFPYKVGDKVQHKGATSCGSVFEVEKMRWVDEHVEYTVKRLWYHNGYSVVTAKDLQPFEEETMDKAVFDANAQCCDISNRLIKEETMEERKYADLRLDVDQDDKLATEVTIDGDKITPPENYLIGKVTAVDNGLLVEFVKKQPQYPKTYEECCTIMGFNSNTLKWNNFFSINKDTHPYIKHFDNLIDNFCKLLICRDAYWKSLGYWKPDWESSAIKYTIRYQNNNILKRTNEYINSILCFPTEEMRDAFYDNYKELIEQCKELI